MPEHCIYLHGFASSPKSRKATLLKREYQKRNLSLDIPNLNVPDFENLTLTAMLAAVREKFRPGTAVLGSSLGGYTAALLAAAEPVEALVLMAPAFDVAARWQRRLGDEGLANWRQDVYLPVFHQAYDRELSLRIGFLDDATTHAPFPDVGQTPTLVFHGTEDDLVPMETVEAFVDGCANAELVVFDDDHALTKSGPEIVERSLAFLGFDK
ncbi:MAG: YqiA/YcfP family alpha/beta fold hydrolase [Planctomycetota bacterium]